VSEGEFPHSELTREVIGAAMEVHRTLGCGFLESVYEEALAVEFNLRGLQFERQKPLDVFYKGMKVKQFLCDFLIRDTVLVELKAVKELGQIEVGQVLNYLKATGTQLGLVLNFGSSSLQYRRVIN